MTILSMKIQCFAASFAAPGFYDLRIDARRRPTRAVLLGDDEHRPLAHPATGVALSRSRHARYWSAHAHPVICHPALPFFKLIVTTDLSVTALPPCVNVRVAGTTRYA